MRNTLFTIEIIVRDHKLIKFPKESWHYPFTLNEPVPSLEKQQLHSQIFMEYMNEKNISISSHQHGNY
ncbi:MAG: hypothetical protein K0U40_09245, partial [Betaproteobacteria bacterium]|nr:hypothetical protein [Betaproteobacteria bacterium]